MAKVIIFGTSDFAQLAHFYLTNDTEHDLIGFTSHASFISSNEFCGLPVFPFETLEAQFPPDEYMLFAPMSPVKMNTIRESIFCEGKKRGYHFISYVSSRAVYYGTPVGENCFIFEANVIQPFTSIGDNVIMWSGNHFGHHSEIGNNSFLASHVVVSGHVKIGNNCFLGVNSTISNGLHISDFSFVGAGALIGKSTEPWGVYPGVKAEKSPIPSNKLRGA
jgi:sugar O-acyltransferase (sialic acid O-acetyltransferase NeuD family)